MLRVANLDNSIIAQGLLHLSRDTRKKSSAKIAFHCVKQLLSPRAPCSQIFRISPSVRQQRRPGPACLAIPILKLSEISHRKWTIIRTISGNILSTGVASARN
jgi:hypothetical protein